MPHSSGASCATCPAFALVPPHGGRPDEGKGDCRAAQPGRLSMRPDGNEFTPAWPRLYPEDWCAAHPMIRPLMKGNHNG